MTATENLLESLTTPRALDDQPTGVGETFALIENVTFLHHHTSLGLESGKAAE
ncbi:hypothetical protein NSPZN2_11071 [Nitrospira defluvii]|uniref:Uncharacterized protein n=1 Tax=Nitrospira defluvii TaxID=330214 RepID=A0ABM8QP87_9BACT|nr:hypothetical protein NSPZN2_11071 [Nitrospira defluvii]